MASGTDSHRLSDQHIDLTEFSRDEGGSVSNDRAPERARRRWAAMILVATVVGLGLTVAAPSATAAQEKASVGYVRLAHLSPDTPDVDVYLSKAGDASFAPKVFQGVGYGVVSQYLPVPTGTYVVAMRLKGADPATKPVISTQVTVTENGAFTVAGTGKHADLGLTVLTDDLSAPAPDEAKVRVIQASVTAPVLDVSTADGTSIAHSVAFATTTSYNNVPPGQLTLKVTPTGSAAPTTISAHLSAGAIYSLLILDGPNGLRAELRVDAAGPGQAPSGAVEAGGGVTSVATQAGLSPLIFVGGGLVVLVGLVAVALRMRRLASRRT